MTAIAQHKSKQKILNKVVLACRHLLTSEQAKKARICLNSRLSKEHQQAWQFGYFPTDDHLSDLTDLVDKKDLEQLNIYYPKYISGGQMAHGHFSEHNLLMPFYNVHGEIVSLVGRCLLSEEERQEAKLNKYKYSAGCKKDLFVYGLNKAKQSIIEKNCVIVTEGQFDAISLNIMGIENVVALGWANISRYQMFQLHRYTNNIILMLDNDEAGQKGKVKIKEKYKDVCNIKLLSPPKGFKDIDEFFRSSKDIDMVNRVICMLNGFAY